MMAVGCPFTITTSVTGDCQNNSSGGFYLNIVGTGPFLLEWIVPNGNPNTSVQFEEIKFDFYQINGLPVGNYSVAITDNCNNPSSQLQVINITISSATCVSIEVEDTICGLSNGSLTATTSTYYGQGFFDVYKDNVYFTGFTGSSNPYIFLNLDDGIYYVIADNGGGCTGRSESCIIMSSSTLEYGLYVVDDGNCTGRLNLGSGKIYVTGLTGNGPFTYLWDDSNKSTTSFLTGLTTGVYSVTITDNLGCVSTQSAQIQKVPLMGLISSVLVQPSCYGNDGDITLTISGGSAPYYYLNNNTGEVKISFNQTVTFENLAAGVYSFTITDAGLCTYKTSVTLLTPNIFNVLSVNSINATCQNTNGSISILLNGGTPPYLYKLINSQSSSIQNITSLSPTFTFSNLSADTYTLIINDNTNSCVYQQFVTISALANFTVSATTSQPLCGNNNGSITITKSQGGTAPFVYSLNNVYFSPQTLSTAYTFNNLTSGFYNVKVTDSTGCTQITAANLTNSSSLDFYLSKTDVNVSNDGTINVYITSGNPPFTTNWSSNVNGQSGLTLNSLSAGTYSVTIVDSSGCSKTSQVQLLGRNFVGDFQVFNICSGVLTDKGIPQKQGIKQMLSEGFLNLTSGNTGCVLSAGKMTAIVNIGGTIVSNEFYTSTSLSDIPSDTLWVTTITNLIKSIYGVGDVTISIPQNTIKITSDCNLPSNVLLDVSVIVDLKIDYDIKCISCGPVFQVFTACCDNSYWLVSSQLGNFEIGDTIYTTGGCMSFAVVDPDTITITGIVDNEIFENGQYVDCNDCISSNIACTPSQSPSPTPTPTITPTLTPSITPTVTPSIGLSPTPTPTNTTTPTPTSTTGLAPTQTPTPTITPTNNVFNTFYSFPTGTYGCVSNFVQFTQLNTISFYVSPGTNIYNTSQPFQLYLNAALTFPFTISAIQAPLFMRIGNNIWSISQAGVATYTNQVGSPCIFA